MAIILHCNGRDREEFPTSQITLENLQRVVEGYVERILCYNSDNTVTHILYVNDEARMLGMPLNQEASAAARINILGEAVLMTVEEEREKLV